MKKLSLLVILLIVLAGYTNTFSSEEPVKGWYDSENGWFVFEYERPGKGTVRTYYDSPNNIVPLIKAQILANKEKGSFLYEYTVENKGGLQPLYIIEIEHYYGISDAMKPNKNWYMDEHEEGDLFEWAKTRKKPKGILPGESVRGFSFQSLGPPAIANSYFFGYDRVRYNPPGDYDTEEVNVSFSRVMGNMEEQYPDKFNDVILKTVAPGPIPEELVPADFLQNLIDMKHEATELGWVTNEGIERSLDAKLDSALKKLQSGNTKAASNILGAFINEVEAQGCESYDDCPKGKHLTPEAYALLKFNAQYLIDNIHGK